MEMQLRYLLQGQQCINVFHYKLSGSLIDGALGLSEYLTQFNANMGAALQAFITSDGTNLLTRGQFVYPTRFVPQELGIAGGAGTATPPTESVGTSIVLRKLSDVASRSARGRIFLGGIAQTAVDIGTVTSGIQSALLAAWQPNIIMTLTSVTEIINADPVIWSYTDPTNTNRITNGTVDPYCRYQRRREVGRGI